MQLVVGDEHLRIAVRQERDRTVLELRGELDLLGAPLLERELDRAQERAPGMIVLDLEELQFIDSAGLRVILAGHEQTRARGVELAVTRGPRQVQRLLEIAGVGDRLRIIASADEITV
jgi:anti-sigma B factor antagonist